MDFTITTRDIKENYQKKRTQALFVGLCSLFRMKLRNLSLIIGNDGLNLHRFHNGVGTEKWKRK